MAKVHWVTLLKQVKTWIQTCAAHDNLGWDSKHDFNNPYPYIIPIGSFCSEDGLIYDTDPWSMNCQPEALPIVTFHFRHNYNFRSIISESEYCVVDMRLPLGNSENQDCIKKILQFYQSSNYVYFIWLVHGWTHGGKSDWLEDMKHSYFIKYPQQSG